MSAVDEPSRNDAADEGLGSFVRRVLRVRPAPEERLERLLAARRQELDDTASHFDASVADLERREELLRDSRASVERMLRLGRGELDAREKELEQFAGELAERERRLADAEAEIGQRRQELGAVELRRAALERRERELEARADELAEREPVARGDAATSSTDAGTRNLQLAFVAGAEYTIVEVDLGRVRRGAQVDIGGAGYVVAKVGPSPLPGDSRRCAYLMRAGT